jgi:tripartite-type tricarboxylate transporter receptor subunit TctC
MSDLRNWSKRYPLMILFCLIVFPLATGGAYAAEKFPTRFIEVVVPYAPGGALDNTIRIIGADVEKILGQKLVILNKPAGGGIEGQRYAANAAPNGYTILAMSAIIVTNLLTKQVDYTMDSFDWLMMYGFDPLIFVINADLPYKTIAEVVAAAKQKPLSFSTPGKGNARHVGGTIIEMNTGAKFNYVHTKGSSEAIPMIAGGHVQAGCFAWGEVRALIQQGKLRPISVMDEERSPELPNVPTFAEAGYKISYGAWRGFAAPKGLPPEVRATLVDAFTKALHSPETKKKMETAGFYIAYRDGEKFKKFAQEDYNYVKDIMAKLK